MNICISLQVLSLRHWRKRIIKKIITVEYDNGSRIPGARMVGVALNQVLRTRFKQNKQIQTYSADLFDCSASTMVNSINKFINGQKTSEQIVLVGGDHSVAVPAIEYFLDNLPKGTKPVLILFDAHLDYFKSDSEAKLKNWNFIQLFKPFFSKVICIGWRNYKFPVEQDDFIELIGVKDLEGNISLIQDRLSIFEKGSVYISFDIDCFSHRDAPGVSYPLPGGPDFQTIFLLYTFLLDTYQPKVLDICEFNPMIEKEKTEAVLLKLIEKIL